MSSFQKKKKWCFISYLCWSLPVWLGGKREKKNSNLNAVFSVQWWACGCVCVSVNPGKIWSCIFTFIVKFDLNSCIFFFWSISISFMFFLLIKHVYGFKTTRLFPECFQLPNWLVSMQNCSLGFLFLVYSTSVSAAGRHPPLCLQLSSEKATFYQELFIITMLFVLQD